MKSTEQPPVAWFPQRHLEEIELVGIDEKTSAHEAAREVLGTLASLIDELEEAECLRGGRLAIFGSAVTEPKPPSDIDLAFIYDEIDPEKKGKELSREAEALLARLTDYESEEGGSPKIKIAVAPEKGKKLPMPPKIDITITRSDELVELVKEDPVIARITTGMAMEMVGHEEDIPQDVAPIIKDFTYIIDLLEGNLETDEDYAPMLELLDEPTKEHLGSAEKAELTKRFASYHAERIDDAPLRARFVETAANPESHPDIERRELIGDLVRYISDRLPYEKSKAFRSSYTTYRQGLNFTQSTLASGTILIKGENVRDETGGPIFKIVDRKWLTKPDEKGENK